MSAEEFFVTARGEDPAAASKSAVENAQYECGHGGYSGTTAEKSGYVVVRREPLSVSDAQAMAEQLLADQDSRVDDKRGPAGAIACKKKDGQLAGWLFFGWASS